MQLRELLFADQDLDAILSGMPNHDCAGAKKASNNPWPLLAMARSLRNEGRARQAALVLKRVAEAPGVETRVRLWAWHALRKLGVRAEGTSADEVLGVVIELPLPLGVDTLAAYRDGTVRYVNQGGDILIFDGKEPKGLRRARRLLDRAQAQVAGMPFAPRRLPPKTRLRCTLLTRQGSRCAEEDVKRAGEPGRYLTPVFEAAAHLLYSLWGEGEPPPDSETDTD